MKIKKKYVNDVVMCVRTFSTPKKVFKQMFMRIKAQIFRNSLHAVDKISSYDVVK
jgi:hypothetical protein